jgi:hypothetical protein
MKKFALLTLLPLLFWGCEKTYDTVINPSQNNSIQVVNINPIDTLNYNTSDSVLTFAITFNSSQQIQSVYCNILTPAGVQLNSSAIILYDDGNLSAHGDSTQSDNTYSNKFTMSNSYINGVYLVQYYVTDIFEATNYVSAQNFFFNNGTEKFAPVISNVNIPDTVALGQTFVFNVTASDSNGLNDIELVYFQLYRPDSSIVDDGTGNTFFEMHDDGNTTVWGDTTAGDGIYSFKNSFSPTAQLGSWRFEFQALDRSSILSNKIIKNVEVTQ